MLEAIQYNLRERTLFFVSSIVLSIFVILSFVGLEVFVEHPEMISEFPWAADIYVRSFPFFSQMTIWVAFLGIGALLWKASNAHWLPVFIAVYALSLGSELAGTITDLPFGAYGYTHLLGVKWFSEVPLVIPISWFTASTICYVLVLKLSKGGLWLNSFFIAALMVGWDLSLDPVMSKLFPYWTWDQSGSVYYGMPWINLFGWFVTSFLIGLFYEKVGFYRIAEKLPLKPTATLGFIYLALSLGLCVFADYWLAFFASLVYFAVVFYAMKWTLSAEKKKISSKAKKSAALQESALS
jgi:uncharacterized membrane protein